MKRIFILIIILMIIGTVSPKAEAMIMDLPDVGGQGFFKDLNTGFTWMDVDNFFGMNIAQINTNIAGSNFHVATFSEITQLHLAAPADPSLFAQHASIMGNSTTRNLIWGYYDDDGNLANGGGWSFKWGPNPFGQATNVWFTPVGSGTNQTFSDLGGWVVDSRIPEAPIIPEIPTLAYLASGFLSSLMTRRKKK